MDMEWMRLELILELEGRKGKIRRLGIGELGGPGKREVNNASV